LKKWGQRGFEAFLNPPKSPFAKGGLATTSLRLSSPMFSKGELTTASLILKLMGGGYI